MGTYGRNFDFRIPPTSEFRPGRYVVPSTGTAIPLGAPVTIDTTGDLTGTPDINQQNSAINSLGLQLVKLAVATGGTTISSAGSPGSSQWRPGGNTGPVGGRDGVLVYEYGPAAFAGNDPWLTTYSDKDTAPAGKAVQLVHGPFVRVVFTNTVSRVFLGQRTYAGRIMVSGLGTTPNRAVGDLLAPSSGANDTLGYWDTAASLADAWMVVVEVDTVRNETVCQMLF